MVDMKPPATSRSAYAYALGLGSAALIMTFFSLAWWGIASQGVPDRWQRPYWLLIDGSAVLLVAVTARYLRSVAKLPHQQSREERAAGRNIGRQLGIRFGVVFGLEIFFAAAASILLNASNHAEYFFPVLAIIVGVHFLPLATLFQVRAYFATGICLSLVGMFVIFATPSTATVGAARLWDIVPGLLSGPILFVTAILVLIQGCAVLRQARVTSSNGS